MKRTPITVRTRLGQPVRKRVLLCERCGHSWDWHEHSESPVPKAEPSQRVRAASAARRQVLEAQRA